MGFYKDFILQAKADNYAMTDALSKKLLRFAQAKYKFDADTVQSYCYIFLKLLDERKPGDTTQLNIILRRSHGWILDSLRAKRNLFWICNPCGTNQKGSRRPMNPCKVCGASDWSYKLKENSFLDIHELVVPEKPGTKRIDWHETFYKTFKGNLLKTKIDLQLKSSIWRAVKNNSPIRCKVGVRNLNILQRERRGVVFLSKKPFDVARAVMAQTLQDMEDLEP